MKYAVLEIQELNGTPTVIQKPVSDVTDIEKAKAEALKSAAYWADPPAGIEPPQVVTVAAITEDGRPVPGYTWCFRRPVVIIQEEPTEPEGETVPEET